LKKKLYILSFMVSTLLYAETSLESTKMKKSSWGIEFNPFRVLILGSDWQSFSGTLTHFDNENGIEIAMPILYSKETNGRYNSSYEDSETVLSIDLHYRKYFSGDNTDGTYLGLFGRYTYLDGKVLNKAQYATVEKFGIGGEVGVKKKRIFDTPFYWGMSLSLGGYIGSDSDMFHASGISFGLDDNKLILDVELLKVGYEF
jgi:hypothetical protein